MRVSLGFAALATLLAVASTVEAQSLYTATKLGTLGGSLTYANAINDNGQIAGQSSLHNGALRAFVWSDASGMRNLGVLNAGDASSGASAINNSGLVVGSSDSRAFRWTRENGMQDLGSLGGTFATALGINNLGQVVGYSGVDENKGHSHAFLWTQAQGMSDLGTLGGDVSVAFAINDSGLVVGYSYLSDNLTVHACVWTQANGIQDLGTLGGINSSAFAANDEGTVVGSSREAENFFIAHPFVWDTTHGMRSIADTREGVGTGINASNQVVGLEYLISFGVTTTRPWLSTKTTGLKNLNALVIDAPEILTGAFGINKIGQIAAETITSRAVLLTPVK